MIKNTDINGYDVLAAADSKSLDNLIVAVETIKQAGYLKDHLNCAGEIIYKNYSVLFEQVQAGDFSKLYRIFDIASSKTGSSALEKYVSLYFPLRLTGENGKLKSCQYKSKEIEAYRKFLIKFDTFNKLQKTSSVSIEKIKSIRSAIKKEYQEDWRVVIKKYLKWPSTNAPQSLIDLVQDGWVTSGVLSFHNYHVGEEGEPALERRKALNKILNAKLDAKVFNKNYISQWGNPGSLERLMKLATTIAALCRNAKRSKFNYIRAVREWEEDLAYLKDNFFDKQLNLEAR